MSASEGRMSEAEDAVDVMIVASRDGIMTTLWSLKEAPLGVDDMAADVEADARSGCGEFCTVLRVRLFTIIMVVL